MLCGGRVCCVTMSSKEKSIMSNSTNLVSFIVSMIALMLAFVAFLRIEIQLNSQETKMAAVEQSCFKRIDQLSSEFTEKLYRYSSEGKSRNLRSVDTAGVIANNQTLTTERKLMEIREEIKDDLQRIQEENRRVCRTALGSVMLK